MTRTLEVDFLLPDYKNDFLIVVYRPNSGQERLGFDARFKNNTVYKFG